MSHDVAHTKELAHQLIDRLPEAQLSGLVQFLETIIDPVTAALRKAPPEDESISEKEERAVAEARDWLKRHGGKGIPHAKAMRRLGLSDGDRMDREGAGGHGRSR